jgi:hypothetical protein
VTEDDVRNQAQAVGEALVAGNMDAVIESLSEELRRNLGEVVALLPLPASEAVIESVERGGLSHVVVTRVVGESEEVQVQTRWKDRDGTPKIVEVSHRTAREAPAGEDDVEGGTSEGAGSGET